ETQVASGDSSTRVLPLDLLPEVSFIVPTYRRPEKLERALASIRPACSVPHEIIVVDDCSEGTAFAVAQRFGAQYVCKAGRSRGLSKSRNIGMALAKAERLVFIDDDDYFSPGGIDALYRASVGGSSFVFGDCGMLHGSKRVSASLSTATRQA